MKYYKPADLLPEGIVATVEKLGISYVPVKIGEKLVEAELLLLPVGSDGIDPNILLVQVNGGFSYEGVELGKDFFATREYKDTDVWSALTGGEPLIFE